MESKKIIYLLMIIGLIAGNYIPMIWGAGTFSMSAIIFSALGGIVGIYLGYKLSR